MAWNECGKPKDIDLTPLKAKKFLDVNKLPSQRPVSDRWVNTLLEEYNAGRFNRADVTFAIDKETSHVYLINGQHTCHLAADHNVTIPIRMRDFECDDMTSVTQLYGTIDCGRGRTQSDVLRARMSELPSPLCDYPMELLGRALIALIYLGDRRDKPPVFTTANTMTKAAKVDYLIAHKDDVIRIRDLWTSQTSRLLPSPVLAAMIATFRVNAEAALEFWPQAINGIGIENKAIAAIHTYLLTGEMIGNRRIPGSSMAPRTWAKIISWWNTWRTGGTRNGVNTGQMKTLPVAQ